MNKGHSPLKTNLELGPENFMLCMQGYRSGSPEGTIEDLTRGEESSPGAVKGSGVPHKGKQPNKYNLSKSLKGTSAFPCCVGKLNSRTNHPKEGKMLWSTPGAKDNRELGGAPPQAKTRAKTIASLRGVNEPRTRQRVGLLKVKAMTRAAQDTTNVGRGPKHYN
jgi:hypothetical protein